MRVAHAINHSQVDAVLKEFDATTEAIRGIEVKMKRMQAHAQTANQQRTAISRHAQDCTDMMDAMSKQLIELSEDALEFFAISVDRFAGLFETLEVCVRELGVFSAHKELQRELWPLLVPVMCLCIIITASNCVFGFRLAGDTSMAQFDLDMLKGVDPNEEDTNADVNDSVSLLSLFAIFHVVLVGCAVLYMFGEIIRRIVLTRMNARARVLRQKVGLLDEEEEPQPPPVVAQHTSEEVEIDSPRPLSLQESSPSPRGVQASPPPLSPASTKSLQGSAGASGSALGALQHADSKEAGPQDAQPMGATPSSLYSSLLSFLNQGEARAAHQQSLSSPGAGARESPPNRAEADGTQRAARPSGRSEGGVTFSPDSSANFAPTRTSGTELSGGGARRRSMTENSIGGALQPSASFHTVHTKGGENATSRTGPVSGLLRNIQRMTDQVVHDISERKGGTQGGGHRGGPSSPRAGDLPRKNSTVSSSRSARGERLPTLTPGSLARVVSESADRGSDGENSPVERQGSGHEEATVFQA
mmetsp:Transcript_50863/g.114388  ORF Transcript_50863/g.114388 Transcript_50863/m.114388 type:complete len:531 (-) Transcript_50863:188-1780(-)